MFASALATTDTTFPSPAPAAICCSQVQDYMEPSVLVHALRGIRLSFLEVIHRALERGLYVPTLLCQQAQGLPESLLGRSVTCIQQSSNHGGAAIALFRQYLR